MHASFTRRAAKGLALTALAASLGLASCQNMNAFVTGEQFYRAPEGSPRVEIELVVAVQDEFYAHIDDEDARQTLEGEIAELVLSHADVGLRFYPIASESYAANDPRPAYVMFVDVRELEVDADHDLIEEEGRASYVDSTLRGLDCLVLASVEKRRESGPPLRVGKGEGRGHVYVGAPPQDGPEQASYRIKRWSPEHQIMDVLHSDVLAVVDEAVVDALREVIRPIDRDFELTGAGNP